MITKIELTREDWEHAKKAGINMYKEALAHLEVARNQIETAEKKLEDFPEEEEEIEELEL